MLTFLPVIFFLDKLGLGLVWMCWEVCTGAKKLRCRKYCREGTLPLCVWRYMVFVWRAVCDCMFVKYGVWLYACDGIRVMLCV